MSPFEVSMMICMLFPFQSSFGEQAWDKQIVWFNLILGFHQVSSVKQDKTKRVTRCLQESIGPGIRGGEAVGSVDLDLDQ